MKEKLKMFMQRGGLTLLIGFAAVGAYLFILDSANKYFDNNVTNSLYISVNENGELSINYSETDEIIYVCWETDGGNLIPVDKNSEFKEQWKEDNKWYQAYTEVHEKVKWDSLDADGNEYTTATVRALIYQKSEEKKKNQYYMGDFVKDLTITISLKDGKVEKSEDRYFSNPVRKGAENESWNQIYIIEETEDLCTLRYRTSEDLSKKGDDKIYVLCWESGKKIMAQTDIVNGCVPNFTYILEDNGLTDKLNTVNTVTLDFKKADLETADVEAFLVDSEHYKNYNEEQKEYRAEINIR